MNETLPSNEEKEAQLARLLEETIKMERQLYDKEHRPVSKTALNLSAVKQTASSQLEASYVTPRKYSTLIIIYLFIIIETTWFLLRRHQ